MTSILGSQGVVLATAMAAFSGTVILLALRIQKSCLLPSNSQFHVNPNRVLRPCLSSGERKGEKKKKKVRFSEDVVDPTGDNEVFRRQHHSCNNNNDNDNDNNSRKSGSEEIQKRGMPANRIALYNGILKNRVIHRMGYSY